MHQRILFITAIMDDYAEEKRTEQNLIVRSGKSTTEDCPVEANY